MKNFIIIRKSAFSHYFIFLLKLMLKNKIKMGYANLLTLLKVLTISLINIFLNICI